MATFWAAAEGLGPSAKLRRRRGRRQALVVRVDLRGVRPPIWRRLKLASDLNLEQLDGIVQIAMGWAGGHLHSFDRWRPVDGEVTTLSLTTRRDEEYESGAGGQPEWEVELSQVLAKPKDWIAYTYDFGDDWNHRIALETAEPWVDGEPLAQCLGGRRACPPEDCGGIWGFEEILEALRQNPGDDWVDTEWFEGSFDPTDFDAEQVGEELAEAERDGFLRRLPF
jgi:hypothetical protein